MQKILRVCLFRHPILFYNFFCVFYSKYNLLSKCNLTWHTRFIINNQLLHLFAWSLLILCDLDTALC